MTLTPAEETLAYIDDHYLPRVATAARCNISEERLVELVEAKCTPPHAYAVERPITCISSFGAYDLSGPVEFYYHPRHCDWVARAEGLAEQMPLAEVARIVRERFFADVQAALGGAPLPWKDGIDLVWTYLMDGTWSLCLKDYDVESLVQKELARHTIKTIEAAAVNAALSTGDRQTLQDAVARFEDVALPFSPHEVAESSRCLEVNAAIQKFKLEHTEAAG